MKNVRVTVVGNILTILVPSPLHLIALATWAQTNLGRLVTFRSGGSYDEGPM